MGNQADLKFRDRQDLRNLHMQDSRLPAECATHGESNPEEFPPKHLRQPLPVTSVMPDIPQDSSSNSQVPSPSEPEHGLAIYDAEQSEGRSVIGETPPTVQEDSELQAAMAFLEDLEARHNAVLEQLDQLNQKIETVLESYLQQRSMQTSAAKGEGASQSDKSSEEAA